MKWAVIMAGGNGTRFWPLSNAAHPKQFLKLLGHETPAETCLRRISRVVDEKCILIVASVHHKDALREALPGFPEDQILWEPIGRNTAPCIAWVTEYIRMRDKEAKIGVFPSDHNVPDEAAFASALSDAYSNAKGRIVLFGIEPTRPETGYGYIEQGEQNSDLTYQVASFREKPDLDVAQSYLNSGKFLWNSGMFIFDAETMHEELERFVPQITRTIEEIVNNPEKLEALFGTLLSISIDYAVMEHTDKAVVQKASFEWDDLGTWASIRHYYETDGLGNGQSGEVKRHECQNTFVYSGDGRKISLLGVKDLVVVSTPEAVLVMDLRYSQDVKKVIF